MIAFPEHPGEGEGRQVRPDAAVPPREPQKPHAPHGTQRSRAPHEPQKSQRPQGAPAAAHDGPARRAYESGRHRPLEAAASRRIAEPAVDQRQSACGDPRSTEFPLGTRLHGGPGTYRPGGGSAEWYLDLVNATATVCRDIHPVLVLVDRKRALRPEHVQAGFQEAGTGTWHPLAFVRTDEDELVAVFGEDAPGFTVGPGRTLGVKVRLGFTGDTRPDTVVARAAVVQRMGDDGEWVGESGDYRFVVDPRADTGDPDHSEGVGSPAELARTGSGALLGLGGAAVVLLLGGGALVVGSRRMQTPPKR
jgi:hypothetical protein